MNKLNTSAGLLQLDSIHRNTQRFHERLTPDDEQRAVRLYRRLGFKLVHETVGQFVDGFCMERRPWRELAIYEAIADTLDWAKGQWPTKSRRNLFNLILRVSNHQMGAATGWQDVQVRQRYFERLAELLPGDDGRWTVGRLEEPAAARGIEPVMRFSEGQNRSK